MAANRSANMLKRLALLWTLVRGDLRRLWRAVRHPNAPLWLKLGVAGLAIYALSPIDLVPDFIPFLGIADDLVLVTLGVRFLLSKLPAQIRDDIARV
jgi:uncharacterized membrane protein YkvA (DUF1232 family)